MKARMWSILIHHDKIFLKVLHCMFYCKIMNIICTQTKGFLLPAISHRLYGEVNFLQLCQYQRQPPQQSGVSEHNNYNSGKCFIPYMIELFLKDIRSASAKIVASAALSIRSVLTRPGPFQEASLPDFPLTHLSCFLEVILSASLQLIALTTSGSNSQVSIS